MAAWLPLLNASLPYVTQLITVAIPAFTSKPGAGKSEDIVAKQVTELQAAVTGNAESIRGLAAELKQTIEGIDAAGQALQQQIAELQVGVSHNAESIRGLAAELKQTTAAIDAAGQALQQELIRLRRLAVASMAVAIAAVIWTVVKSSGA
jgi:septal ring factor EnvC (AmiA/AmiB activator)